MIIPLRQRRIKLGKISRLSRTTTIGWVVAITLAILPAEAQADVLEMVVAGKHANFSLEQLKAKLKVHTIKIEDIVYGKPKTYDGFALPEVLKLAGLDNSASGDELVFTAKDGYSPNMQFAPLREHHAFLVFQEHGKHLEFEKVAQGKAMISPGPYYVVWEEGKKLKDTVPWPYQLAKIEVVSFAQKYVHLYPRETDPASAVFKGFVVFKNQCLRCHSINLEGGTIGPELNAPLNVTEYWAKDTMLKFIRDPAQFRYRDKMPGFRDQLKPEEIEDVYAYLVHMKAYKIKSE